MEEQELKCNLIACRRTLTPQGKACVTTCSHIFCLRCANKCFEAALVCPACETTLTQPDDIVFVDLNPSQEYRSSILSGLRPEIIMEICTRAISFWTYQTAQEARFQELTQKSLEDQLGALEKQLQKTTRDVNAELSGFRETVGSLQKELEQEKRKAVDLSEQLDEKSRQFSKVQTLYDRQKRRPLFSALDQQSQQQRPPLVAAQSASSSGWNGNAYNFNQTQPAMQDPSGMATCAIPLMAPPNYPLYQPLHVVASSPLPLTQQPPSNSLFSPRRMATAYPGQSIGQRLNNGPRP